MHSKKKDKDKSSSKGKEGGKSFFSLFRKTKGFDRTDSVIPLVVSEPIAWMRSHNALGEEGIFRVPGSATDIKNLKARYDKGKKVDLETQLNVHTVAGILKIFFRELPEPLLTFELYEAWLAAVQAPDLETQLEFLKKVLNSLPAGNRAILKELMGFLHEVSTIPTNCMNATNLAIVFAPNLIRPRVESMETILMSSSNVNMLIQMLIMYYEQIFLAKELPDGGVKQVQSMSPHLISLKQAQEKVHGQQHVRLSLPAGADASPQETSPPVSPREKEKKSPRKAAPTKKESKKNIFSGNKKAKKQARNTVMITSASSDNIAEIPAKRKMSAGASSNPRQSFYETLKAGTLSLAATLLEEQDLIMEIQEVENLSGESRAAAEEQLRIRLEAEKRNKINLKRQQRTSRRLRNSTFLDPSSSLALQTALQNQGAIAPGSPGTRLSALFEAPKQQQSEPQTTTPEPAPAVAQITEASPVSPAAPEAANTASDVATIPVPFSAIPPPLHLTSSMTDLPTMLPPSPVNMGLYMADVDDEDDDEDFDSDSDSDFDSDSDSDSEVFPAVTSQALPPPPASIASESSEDETNSTAKIEANLQIKVQITNVVEKVAEGDIDELTSFLGQMKSLPKMERQKSKNVLLQRMQIKRQQISTEALQEADDEAEYENGDDDEEFSMEESSE